jgi:maltose alpha-D-glucosyltransferase/alpha-amylase
MIRVRKDHSAFGYGDLAWLHGASTHIAAFWRADEGSRILAIHNLAATDQRLTLDVPGVQSMRDMLGSQDIRPRGAQFEVTLGPYQFRWLAVD